MADAPSSLIAELLGEAFIKAVERNQSRTVEQLRSAWNWLCDVAEPPAGTRLTVPGGTVHSGVAVIERNRVLLLVAVRHGRGGIEERSQRRRALGARFRVRIRDWGSRSRTPSTHVQPTG